MEHSESKSKEEHLCRLCGKMQQNAIQIFDDNRGNLVTLIRRTLGYLNMEFVIKEVSTVWLCASCHLDAESTDRFLLMVEEGQRNLRQQIQESSQTCGYTTTVPSKDKPTIKLETDCPEDSSEYQLNHQRFEITEIDQAPTNTQSSVNDLHIYYIKTEDYALSAPTLDENRLRYDSDSNSHEKSYVGSTQQDQHCTSDSETELYQCQHCSSTYKMPKRFAAGTDSKEMKELSLMLPMALDQIQVVDSMLESKAYADAMISLQARLKGKEGSVDRVLRGMFRDEAMYHYNLEGKASKKSLINLKMINLLFGIFPKKNKKDVRNEMKKYVSRSHNRYNQKIYITKKNFNNKLE